jgi:hypothetical protein
MVTSENHSNVKETKDRWSNPMTYAAHHKNLAAYAGDGVPAKRDAVAKKAGVLRRIIDAVLESRQRQADREIARFIARSGGRLTDDLERQMTQHLATSDWSVRE